MRWRQPSARARLAGIALQQIDLGRPEIARVDPHQLGPGAGAEADLVEPAAAPDDLALGAGERQLDQLAHAVRLAGRQHVVVRRVLLQDPPHALDVVAGMAPVAPGIEVAEVQPLLQPERDRRDRARDLAGDEGLAAQRALVVEQDAVRGVIAVGLAVVDRDPVRVELGDRIGAARVERRGLALRRLGAWPNSSEVEA